MWSPTVEAQALQLPSSEQYCISYRALLRENSLFQLLLRFFSRNRYISASPLPSTYGDDDYRQYIQYEAKQSISK